MDLVKTVFKQMGGTVIEKAPRHPHHTALGTRMTPDRDAFLMDFENALLRYWRSQAIPKGPRRHEHTDWAELVKSNVYPHHSDIDWAEYVDWVENGGGDEWFQEE